MVVTSVKSLYAVAESCGCPVVFVEAHNAATAANQATGTTLRHALSTDEPDWVIAPVTPEQRAEIEALQPESVISYLRQLPDVIGRNNPIV